ncbi:MAG: hypothetical protein ACI8ZO_000409 [Flavobacteriales bacterium]|jgi:hypothetical protein
MFRLILIFIAIVNSVYAQKTKCADQFFVDKLGSVYTLKNNLLSKKDIISGKEYIFTNPSLGILTDVDVANPNTLVLFYEDSQFFVILNRDLNLYMDFIDISRLDLRFRVNKMTATAQRTIWFTDYSNQSLRLFDIEQNAIITEVPLFSIFGSKDEIVSLDADLNNVYIELQNGVYACLDGLGVFLKKVSIQPNVKWVDGMAYYVQDDILKSYDSNLLQETIKSQMPSGFCDFDISKRFWQTINAKGEISKGVLN